MDYTVEAQGLTRRFGERVAVDDLTFAVEHGEIFGLLGPNGAGKTTTIRMLTTQLRPTAGTARILGRDVIAEKSDVKPLIGVVFEHQNVYERLSARDNLTFAASLYGVDGAAVGGALARVGLSDRAREVVSHYSNGMRQRLLIARALLHKPRVLFLDEPTRGLDPAVAREIRTLVRELADQGTSILLTTHYMEEADQLCAQVCILDRGKIVALDSPDRLKASLSERLVEARLQGGTTERLRLDDDADGRRLGSLAASGQVLSLHSVEPSLEEVFVRLTGRRLDE
jgi:ABC-2 type transport system ATP-binding protein